MSLEHQNPSKTSENMADFDRVTVSLHMVGTIYMIIIMYLNIPIIIVLYKITETVRVI